MTDKEQAPAWPFQNPAWPFQPMGGAPKDDGSAEETVYKSATEQKLEKEKMAKEKEAALALAEREARLNAKREAEAKAIAIAEAEAAKAAIEAEAEWKRSFARMDESEVLNQQLEKELSEELKEVRDKLEMGAQAVATIETEIEEVQASALEAKDAKTAEIDSVAAHTRALKQVLNLIRGFEAEASSLERESNEAREQTAQIDANAIGIASRLNEEVEEAEARLSKAEGRGAELEARLAALKAEAQVKERSAEAEVDRLSSAAIAARLRASLGQRHSDQLVSELSRLQEAEDEANRYRTKKARADETRAAVEKLTMQLSEDESQERRLELAGESASATTTGQSTRAERINAAFDKELESAKRLAETQASFLEIAISKGQSVEDESARSLLENTIKQIEERRAATLASITKMEEEQTEKSTMDDGAEEAARGAIKLNAAERKAAEAARVEHQRYLEQLEKQLELEEKDCRQALKPIAGRDECISIIRSELTKARQDAEGLEDAAANAEEAHASAARQLVNLKAKHKSAIANLHVQIGSEHSVAKEQHRYVSSMRNRLVLAKEAAPSEMDIDVRARGKALIDETAAAARSELTAAEAALADLQSTRDSLTEELAAMESKVQSTVLNLKEQLDASRQAVESLQTYETSLSDLVAQGATKITPPSQGGIDSVTAAGDAAAKAAAKAAALKAAASGQYSIVDGPSEVDNWLDKKLLGACKKGLASVGVRTLQDLATMDAASMRKALSGVDAPTRSRLMKALEKPAELVKPALSTLKPAPALAPAGSTGAAPLRGGLD